MRGPLMLLLTLALLGLGAAAYFGGTQSVDVPGGVQGGDPKDSADGGGAGPELTSLEQVQGTGALTGERESGTTTGTLTNPSASPVTVRAIDATDGTDIERYWVKPAGFADMAADVPRVVKELGAKVATLPPNAWQDPSLPRLVLVSAPMFQAAEVEVPPNGMVVARLRRANGIVGTVRDGSSAPIRGAAVTVEYLGPPGSTAALAGDDIESVPFPDGFAGATLRRTNETGRFAFDGLPPGLYRTRATRDGTAQVSGPTTVSPGEWTVLNHWFDEHVRLTVTVFGPGGVPAAKSRVLLTPPPTEQAEMGGTDFEILASRYTETDGRATLGPLTPGTYLVRVQSDDGTAEPLPLSITESSPSMMDLTISLSH